MRTWLYKWLGRFRAPANGFPARATGVEITHLVARQEGYDLGYRHGQQEALPEEVRLEMFRKGHSEGFDEGWKAATNTGGG